jgi:hypothetical protein
VQHHQKVVWSCFFILLCVGVDICCIHILWLHCSWMSECRSRNGNRSSCLVPLRHPCWPQSLQSWNHVPAPSPRYTIDCESLRSDIERCFQLFVWFSSWL